MVYTLLFVCLGNICRSPAAENVMNDLIAKAGLSDSITCDSAGTASYHVGEPPDRRMSSALMARGLQVKGKARQFEVRDFEKFDLILAMDCENYRHILALDPQKKYSHKVRLMCEFASRHTQKEVPDPYYGGRDGFELVIDLLSDACEGLLKFAQQENQKIPN